MAFGDFARLDGYDPDATFPPVRDAFEAAAERLRRGNIRQQGEGVPRAEAVMGALAEIARPIIETPRRTMAPNPYPPGSELAHAFEDQRSRAANVWAGERATDMIGTGLVAKPGVATLGSGAVKPGIRAYHGSPHDFDRFDLSKIGTGEGAQAYGHGLYFAENEGVARGYRDALAAQQNAVRRQQFPGGVDPAYEHGARSFLESGRTPEQALEGLRSVFKNAREGELEAALSNVTSGTKGRMYEVNLNARPEQFLDWDRPLAEQSGAVRAAMKDAQLGQKFHQDPLYKYPPTGAGLYRSLSNNVVRGGPSTETASTLREAGIPGIRYLDQGSRGKAYTVQPTYKGEPYREPVQFDNQASAERWAKEQRDKGFGADVQDTGSRNYVVWTPEIIEIMRKYGLAGAGATGFGTFAAQDNYRSAP